MTAGGPAASTGVVGGAPFDAAVPAYDATFTDTDLGTRLRAIAWSHLDRAFGPGDRVLELGCGTGADAVHLATRGVSVVATDASRPMCEAAGRRAILQGAEDLVRVHPLDLDRVGDPGWAEGLGAPFDGAFSDFGAVGCVQNRVRLFRGLAQVVRPRGRVVLVVMGPCCPLEVGWLLLHGEVRAATRRWRSGSAAKVPGGGAIRVWYPSAGRVAREAAPWFREVGRGGIGIALPPSGLAMAFARRPALLRGAGLVEERLGNTQAGAALADHWVLELERRPDG